MNKIWPTLYKKNSNSSVQQWTITVKEVDSPIPQAYIIKEYGQVNGKIQKSEPDFIFGKNIGRVNETTPYKQACLEAEAQWVKKKTGEKGYVESIDDANAGKSDALVQGGILPMLAHKFSERGDKIVFPAFVQPKLDGIRCIATIDNGKCTLWTRTRKPIVSVPHIIEALEKKFSGMSIIIDGELYNHDYRDKFEEIISLVRPEYVKPGSTVVQYHIFDIVNDKTFKERNEILVIDFCSVGKVLVRVETIVVNNEDELMDSFAHFRSEGYEGCIIRNSDGLYKNSRSIDLQKIKEFEDDEFKIVDVKEGKGKMIGKAIFTCVTKDGNRFDVKKEGALEALKEYFVNKDKYIGSFLTVRYQGLTNGSVPRFGIGVSIRDYE
jgi:DNA ligase-1